MRGSTLGKQTQPGGLTFAVVTGASTGIGYARCCATNGSDLVVAADEPEIETGVHPFALRNELKDTNVTVTCAWRDRDNFSTARAKKVGQARRKQLGQGLDGVCTPLSDCTWAGLCGQ